MGIMSSKDDGINRTRVLRPTLFTELRLLRNRREERVRTSRYMTVVHYGERVGDTHYYTDSDRQRRKRGTYPMGSRPYRSPFHSVP